MENLLHDKRQGFTKCQQIIRSIEKSIKEGVLKKGGKLPSLTRLSMAFSVSRDTVLNAYDEMKKRGLIYALPGKGYYLKSEDITVQQKIFLFFDELNSFKEDLYASFRKNMGEKARIEIFFHQFDRNVFKKMIFENNGDFTKYVIMPANLRDPYSIIRTLPPEDVIILDQTCPSLKEYAAIFQNHESDIYKSLTKGEELLRKYNKLILIFPDFREPIGMKNGFEKFCVDYKFKYDIISKFKDREICKGEVYITPNDNDLMSLIEKSKQQDLKLGTDFGIISYNETALKKVVSDGITTISTDFKRMGERLAEMILQEQKARIANECDLIVRKSV